MTSKRPQAKKARTRAKPKTKPTHRPIQIASGAPWVIGGAIAWDMLGDGIVKGGIQDQEIADSMRLSVEQLAIVCERENGMKWCEWVAHYRALRAVQIRAKQSEAGLGKANVSMLTLLGREELGQGEGLGDEDRIRAIVVIECKDNEELEQIRAYNKRALRGK